MAPAARPHGHLSTLPAPSHSQGHMTARESSLLAPGEHLETITSTPIDCCLLLRHRVGQPSPRQSSGPLRTLPLSSWAPLSVCVARPQPSRTRGPNVPRGRSGSWGKSLTLRARWPGSRPGFCSVTLGKSLRCSVSPSGVTAGMKPAPVLEQRLASVSGLTETALNSLGQRQILIWFRQSLLPRK